MVEFKNITFNNVELKVFSNGNVYKKVGDDEFISYNRNIHKRSKTNILNINRKCISRHRLVAHAFLGLNLTDKRNMFVVFIDKNPKNCDVSNLEVITWKEQYKSLYK